MKYSIQQAVQKFMSVYGKDPYSRFRSYDYIREVFLNAKSANVNSIVSVTQSKNVTTSVITQTVDLDYLALNLYAFLASWGMFRGSGFLLYKSYKVLIPVCRILLEEKYNPLINYNPYTQILPEKQYIDLVLTCYKEIAECFTGLVWKMDNGNVKIDTEINNVDVGKDYYKDLGLAEKISVSDRLVGKIMLGTFGCIPAFDNYGQKGMNDFTSTEGDLSINGMIKLNQKNLEWLLGIANKYKQEIEDAQAYCKTVFGVDYTVMKIIDMFFWVNGADIVAKEKETENASVGNAPSENGGNDE